MPSADLSALTIRRVGLRSRPLPAHEAPLRGATPNLAARLCASVSLWLNADSQRGGESRMRLIRFGVASMWLAAFSLSLAAQNAAWFGTPVAPPLSDPRKPIMKHEDAFAPLPAPGQSVRVLRPAA